MGKFNLTKKRLDNEVFQGVIEAFGSAEALGAFRAGEMKNLSKRQKKEFKANIEKANALTDYYQSQGLAALLKQLQEDAPPTFSERFTPLAQEQAKLLTTTVELPSGGAREEAGANRLSLKEYLEFNAKDPDLFPMNGQVQSLNAMLKNTDLQMQDLMKEQRVSAFVPEGEGEGAGAGDQGNLREKYLDFTPRETIAKTAEDISMISERLQSLRSELSLLSDPETTFTNQYIGENKPRLEKEIEELESQLEGLQGVRKELLGTTDVRSEMGGMRN